MKRTSRRIRTISIAKAVKDLLLIVARLRHTSQGRKKFTLDGRLLGDIGEILVASAYDLVLLDGLQRHHDAVSSDGRRVQIKATMKESLTFPASHVPSYYLGIRIRPDGSFEEIFNGPGSIARIAIKNRQHPKTNLHSISLVSLQALQLRVPKKRRIPLRKAARLEK